jgi:general L-amino acid transport system substrate-binding protein
VATAYFRQNNMAFTEVPVGGSAKLEVGYKSGACNAATGLTTDLHAMRAALDNPNDHVVLPDLISKEPLGPVVLQRDDRWFAVVKWVHFALLNAEELRVTQANVEAMKANANADVRLLLGVDGGLGKDAGLADDWAAKAIAAVGNYGEIFDRNLGAGSPLKISRGLNALWTMGGIQYAPPVH